MRPGREILEEVARSRGLSVKEIVGPTIPRYATRARREVAVRIRTELGYSLAQIGRLLGNRHHTTILYYVNEKRRESHRRRRAAACREERIRRQSRQSQSASATSPP